MTHKRQALLDWVVPTSNGWTNLVIPDQQTNNCVESKPTNTCMQIITNDQLFSYSKKLSRILDISQYKTPIENTMNNAIEKSKSLLMLHAGWDGDTASRIDYKTWERMKNFLGDYSEKAFSLFGRILPTPQISPCFDGSIDIFWDDEQYKLLLNIPNDKDLIISYYGYDKNTKKNNISGTIDEKIESRFFLAWIVAITTTFY